MEFPGLRPMARELGLSYNTIKYYIKFLIKLVKKIVFEFRNSIF